MANDVVVSTVCPPSRPPVISLHRDSSSSEVRVMEMNMEERLRGGGKRKSWGT